MRFFQATRKFFRSFAYHLKIADNRILRFEIFHELLVRKTGGVGNDPMHSLMDVVQVFFIASLWRHQSASFECSTRSIGTEDYAYSCPMSRKLPSPPFAPTPS